jgi:phage protein D
VNQWSPVIRAADAHDPRLFLTPQFEIAIDGAGLPKGVLRDITEVTYRDSLTELDQFDITVNNWDPASKAEGGTRRLFRYIGSETDSDLASQEPEKLLFRLFEPCNKMVKVSLGYLGRMVPMMIGNFTTMEPTFSSSGAATLAVRGLNALHQYRTAKFTTAWENKTPSEIARNLAALTDKGKKRFTAPIEILPGTESGEQAIPFVTQTSQYDIDFLLNFARQHGYEVTLVGDTKPEQKVLFGRASDARRPVNYELDWGRTLVDFKPSLTTAGQFKSITVKGWDRKTQKPISEKVAYDDPELKKMNAKFGELVMQCDPKEEQVVDLPVFSKADARRRAIALMRDNSARIIRANGTTIGLPELRAGTRVKIGGLGARLSGEYLVTKSTHTIGESGYLTKFECRLEDYSGKPR